MIACLDRVGVPIANVEDRPGFTFAGDHKGRPYEGCREP